MTHRLRPLKKRTSWNLLKHLTSTLPRLDRFEPFTIPYTYISTLTFLLTGKEWLE